MMYVNPNYKNVKINEKEKKNKRTKTNTKGNKWIYFSGMNK